MDFSTSRQAVNELRRLILGMRAAFERGENAMAFARTTSNAEQNSSFATLIAYDLQAGSYVAAARSHPDDRARWCGQLAEILKPYTTQQYSILEVGCGEATTLAGVLKHLASPPEQAIGFDISWSRCATGLKWLAENKLKADLFVGDIFEIPLADSSIDVVYTSHSLEPNGGREEEAIRELLRVARRALVLIEPIYELAGDEAKVRMQEHGYVRGLKLTAEKLGAQVRDYRLLDYWGNRLNPSGVVLIEKPLISTSEYMPVRWQCPLTSLPLMPSEKGFYSPSSGIAYPVLEGIPLLCANHAVVASRFEKFALNAKSAE